jgi:hypothetical protein
MYVTLVIELSCVKLLGEYTNIFFNVSVNMSFILHMVKQ